ncbi:MAG: GAK system CofD-like protein [Desulfovibrio sp.]|jgi:CofD-related protein of GAK system|nr:GAK system CofD-like protein [Desulfovibrio sp.]
MPNARDVVSIVLPRRAVIPDEVKMERFRRAPELGPALLFFSGGTAMRDTARALTEYTHNAIHIMTPFDSGGSSAALRRSFNMPAVGDIRARIMALADQSVKGNPEIYSLFSHRLAGDQRREAPLRELASLCAGRHPLIRAVPDPMRKIIRTTLMQFVERMPEDFVLAGASIGNLVLAGGYLTQRRHLDSVIFLYSRLVEARGIVRPVANAVGHLAVRLASGEVIVGQHAFTGKEGRPVSSPIEEIWITRSLDEAAPITVGIRPKLRDLIVKADLVCYPFGSFYSSLIANLLPRGVGRAVAAAPCPKIFMPNLGADPELAGHTLRDQTERLLRHLARDGVRERDVLQALVVDSDESAYPGGIPSAWLRARGIRVVRTSLVSPESFPHACPRLVCRALLSLV